MIVGPFIGITVIFIAGGAFFYYVTDGYVDTAKLYQTMNIK